MDGRSFPPPAAVSPRRWGALWGIALLGLIAVAFPLTGAARNGGHSYALPLAEVEHLAREWLRWAGHDVRRSSGAMGRVRLTAAGPKGKAVLELWPRSPLATEARGRCMPPEKSGCLDGLWKALAAYAEWMPGDEARPPVFAVPEPVRWRRPSVVCVTARGAAGPVRFSGFVADPAGLVLTTAHGLTDLRALRVAFPDGREAPARVLRRDSRRDLLLLETRMAGVPALSLGEGRSGVVPGEAVFSVGCPGEAVAGLHGGVADGPARRLAGLPLVPIRMEIRPGSSGSPVFDADGRLLGMIKGRFRGTATVGFLIPLDTIMDFLRKPSP
jgi:serine protease Do